MKLTIQLKPNGVFLNGIKVKDSIAAKIIRFSEPVKFFGETGITVEQELHKLPYDVLQSIWGIINRLK